MELPDFSEPLLLEIGFARQMVLASHATLPTKTSQNPRHDLSAALGHIAIEHISAVLVMFERHAFASGYALMRSAVETTYKAIWIGVVADEDQVARAHQGDDVYGDFKKVLKDIERAFADVGKWAETFARIRPRLRTLHEHNHSGKAQTLRRIHAEDLRYPTFEFNQVVSDIRTLGALATLAASIGASVEQLQKLNALMAANYSWPGVQAEPVDGDQLAEGETCKS